MNEAISPFDLVPLGKRLASALIVIAMLALATMPAHAGRIEAGTFRTHDTRYSNTTPDPVPFQEPFDTPPIVIALSDSTGNNSASIRITNIGTSSFDELMLEPDNWDGRHLPQTVQYLAVEPGRHVLPDGTVIEAGFVDMSNVQFGTGFTGGVASWNTVTFSAPLPGTPIILHQLQTANSETRAVASESSRPHITSIAQNPSATGFQLAIDRSQANAGPFPSTETVGWIAIQSGGNGTFPDTSGATINWSTRTSAANIRGWSNGCFNAAHGVTSTGTPIVIAKKITRNNQDGGWFRYCTIDATNIRLRVDEDRGQDNERNVAAGDAEAAAIIAFSQSFHANLRADLNVTKVRTSITNTGGSDFGLPGGIVTYLITVSNSGNAPPNQDSVVVTEALPAQLDLLLADYGGAGTGPIDYDDGTPLSSLTCPFVSFADMTDCYSFSVDGVDFTYEPVDSGDGTDPNVRFIRAQPSGFMTGAATGAAPNFTLGLRARIR